MATDPMVVGEFAAVGKFFSGWSQRHDDRARAALNALGAALHETKMYLRDREQGHARQQERENQIVRLWGAAGAELRDVDNYLAEICTYKADYWIDPKQWPEGRVTERRIGIEALYKRYLELHVGDRRMTPQNKSWVRKARQWLRGRRSRHEVNS